MADFHAFRATFATWLAEMGVPKLMRAQLLRHSDARLTRERYTNLRHS